MEIPLLRFSLCNLVRKILPTSLLLFSFLLSQRAVAQDNQTVSGTVTAETGGEVLPGVNISVRGTTIGTTTNAEGEYKLKVPSMSDTLQFSFIGYETQAVPIQGRNTINVALVSTTIAGEELVVTGYSSQRQQDITSAVSSVNVENLQKQTSTSVLQRLDGSVSGVSVQTSGAPGTRNTVRIRGISSFQNNDPLYIIDGTPIQDSYANWLNPNDIESIQVLKDASAASIYGSRANNGVIIIETKKGRPGAPQVTLNLRTGVATPSRGYDDFVITDALQYHEVLKRAYESAGQPVPTNIYGDPNNPSIPTYIWPNDGESQTNDLGQFDLTEDDYAYENSDRLIMPGSSGTNWWDEVFGPGVTQDYNIGVSGGAEDYNYQVSFNYLDQEGTAIYNRFQRGTARVNTQFDLGFFTIGENISVAFDQQYGASQLTNNPDGYAEDGILGKNILMQPVVPVYDVGGNYASGKAVGLGNQGNPVKAAWSDKDDNNRTNRVFGNVFGRLDIMENVLVTSRFGFNLSEISGQEFNPITPENSEPGLTNSISEYNDITRDWTWSNTAEYTETFASHNVNLLVGHEANHVEFRGIDGSIANLLDTSLRSRYIDDALADPGTKNVSSEGFEAALLSFFGKVDYNYSQRYYFSATIRQDGSSRLGSDKRWGTFPAFSVGWRASNETFLQNVELISNLMIRAGWGITGNQQIPAGSIVNQYGGGVGDTFYNIGGDGSSVVAGYRQMIRGNPDLKWEENESINIGVDLELFEGRYNFALDLYRRDTNDLLFAPLLPATAGLADPPVVNVGQMRNTGIDISLGTRGTFGDEVNWTLSLNGSHYQNEVRSIDGSVNFFYGEEVDTRHGFRTINQIGHPIGSFFGLKTDGLFMNEQEVNQHASQDGAAPGRLKFVDENGDGVINADDRTIIGSPHPDFTSGLDFGLQYRNWDFSTTFFASIGNDIYDVQKEYYIFRTFSTTVRKDLLTKSAIVENGQVTNPDAEYPRIDLNDTFSGGQPSDFWVEDGSYVRLRNLQIGYTLPAGIIPRLRNMRVFVQGENLFTITGYDGLDPSLPAANVTERGADTRDQYFGIDRGSYPTSRVFTLGINATF